MDFCSFTFGTILCKKVVPAMWSSFRDHIAGDHIKQAIICNNGHFHIMPYTLGQLKTPGHDRMWWKFNCWFCHTYFWANISNGALKLHETKNTLDHSIVRVKEKL